jgi:hypothetical protein
MVILDRERRVGEVSLREGNNRGKMRILTPEVSSSFDPCTFDEDCSAVNLCGRSRNQELKIKT